MNKPLEAPETTVLLGPGRLQALADGVFSIAMTLLVFELHLPSPRPTNSAELWAALVQLGPKFLSYAIGFLTLGYSWIGHHNQYPMIRRVDRPFLWINIIFFLFIALVPFSSVLLGEYPLEMVSMVFFSGNLCCAGTVLCIHWAYASRRGLLHPDVSPALVRTVARRIVVAPLSYVLVILLTFFDQRLALAVCAVIPFIFIIPGRVDRHWTTQQ